jgi:hypothetical protein
MRVSYCTSDCSSIIIDVLVYALDYQQSTVYFAVQCLSLRLLAMQQYMHALCTELHCTASLRYAVNILGVLLYTVI